MAKAVVLLAPGFEEIQTSTIVDSLRRCGVEITVARALRLSREQTEKKEDFAFIKKS
jgi:hypothetical protein